MKNKKGFTLIELLAVIVILGLLMAIAIPSVTKYITQSRKKTVVNTIGNYITAMVNEVNDLTYTFTEANTIYAVPIECIALERGGTNPFGAWHQASNAYWAYVLVQYDDETSSYTYGYTFKDSAGYGLYPTAQSKLNEQGKQIQTGLDLSLPLNGKAVNVVSINKWTGFEVDSTTDLVVLMSESEGEVGDGKTTCTLQQKGDNYANVEEEKVTRPQLLSKLIKLNNTTIMSKPTLTTTSEEANEKGLYISTDTNSGDATYYFRGDVQNNYVKFAGQTWRIIRINEDGSVRLIMPHVSTVSFNTTSNNYKYMYYSNSDTIKNKVETWYKTNIDDKGYDAYVINGMFCEQAKAKYSTIWASGSAIMEPYSSYTPNFKCSIDGNGKGILSSKVGLITYDEVVHAGAYPYKTNEKYYLTTGNWFWTMSPAGIDSTLSGVWYVVNVGSIYIDYVHDSGSLRPVINLKSDVLATGTGTSSDPYVVQTN